MIDKIKCFFGIHKWEDKTTTKLKGRVCKSCGKRQIYVYGWITLD